MNSPMIFLFFVIFSMKDILLTQSIGILKNSHVSDIKIDYDIRGAFASAKKHRIKVMEYKIGAKSDRNASSFLNAFFGGFFRKKTTTTAATPGILEDIFKTKIIFHNVNFYFHETDNLRTTQFLLVPQNVSDDKMCVSTENLRITLEVELSREIKETVFGLGLFTTLHFKTFLLNVTRTNEAKFVFDFSYEDYIVWNYRAEEKIEWRIPRQVFDFSRSRVDDLTREITPILPVLLREHINRNPDFSRAIDGLIVASFK